MSTREGHFHFLLDLKKGLNKIEVSDLDIRQKVRLKIFSLMNYKFFLLKNYDSTGPSGFVRNVFHTGKNDKFCRDCHEMDPLKANREMCYVMCHKKDIMKWGYMHGPAGEGACLACHDPDGMTSGYQVIVDGGGKICMTCHEGIGSKEKNVHTAVKELVCMGCHSPHGTTNDFILWEDGKAKMCYLCHIDKTINWKSKKIGEGRETLFDDGGMIPYPHKAITDGDCLGCHHPHESENIYNLRKPPGKLCIETDCHFPIQEALSKHKHPYDIQPTQGAPVKIGKNIFVDEKKNVVCYSCHDPHGSSNKYIFRLPEEKLCPSCHDNMEIKMEEKPEGNF